MNTIITVIVWLWDSGLEGKLFLLLPPIMILLTLILVAYCRGLC